MTIQLTTEDFKKKVFDYTAHEQWKYEGAVPAIIDFYADWCEPCKWLDVILNSIEPRVEGLVSIVKVDIEVFHDLKERFHIRGIPVLILFKQGIEVWRINGFLAENELVDKLKSFV